MICWAVDILELYSRGSGGKYGAMLKHLRAAHQRGAASLRECGGLMYLGSTEDSGGEIHQMA